VSAFSEHALSEGRASPSPASRVRQSWEHVERGSPGTGSPYRSPTENCCPRANCHRRVAGQKPHSTVVEIHYFNVAV